MADKLKIALEISVCFLVAGFFIAETSAHRIIFYVFLLLGVINGLDTKGLKESKLFHLVIAYIGINCLSVMWSVNEDLDEYWRGIKIAPFILLSLLISISAYERQLRLYVIAAVVTGGVLIVVNLPDIWGQYVSGSAGVWRLKAYGRGVNENIAGVLYSVAALIIIYHRGFKYKWVCLAIVLSVVFLTLSRGAIVALIATVVIVSLCRGKFDKVYMLSFAGIGGLLILLFPDIFVYMIERGTTGRVEIWSSAIAYFLESPWIGFGIANNLTYEVASQGETYNHTHNIYLSVLNDTGLLGLSIFLSLLGFALYKAFMIAKQSEDYTLLSALIFGSVFGLVDFGGFYTSVGAEWVVFWIPIWAILQIDRHEAKLQDVRDIHDAEVNG